MPPLKAIDRFIWRKGRNIVTIINVTETLSVVKTAIFDVNNICQPQIQSGVPIPRMHNRDKAKSA